MIAHRDARKITPFRFSYPVPEARWTVTRGRFAREPHPAPPDAPTRHSPRPTSLPVTRADWTLKRLMSVANRLQERNISEIVKASRLCWRWNNSGPGGVSPYASSLGCTETSVGLLHAGRVDCRLDSSSVCAVSDYINMF
jgi:hypothetical protein